MSSPLRCVIAATLFVLTAGGIGNVNEGQLSCDVGWAKFRDRAGGETCILPVTTRLPWQQARRECQARVAHLANFDNSDQYAYIGGAQGVNDGPLFETNKPFGDYLFLYSRLFWSGMSIDNETNRLMWDDYSPKYVLKRRFTSTNNWEWGQNQPTVSEGNFCGKIVLNTTTRGFVEGSGFLSTTPPQESPETFDKFLVEMRNCDDSLHFVCQKPAFAANIKTVSNCPDGWVGNVYIPYCFRIFKDFSTYDDAIKNCNKIGGQLAPENTTQPFIRAVVDFSQTNDAYFQQNPISLMWIDMENQPVGDEGVRLCNAYVRGDVTTRPCDTTLPYVCVTDPSETSDDIEVSIASDDLDQQEIGPNFNPFRPLSISGIFSRPRQENEIFSVQTPIGFMNSSASFSGVSLKSPNAYSVRVSGQTDLPYFVNLTFLGDRSSAKKRSIQQQVYERVSNLKRQKRQSGIFALTDGVGYYSFAVYSFNPYQVISTGLELIRPSEKYLLIYVVYETLGDRLGQQIPPADMNKFNLMQLDEYVGYLREVAQSQYQTQLSRYTVDEVQNVFEHIDSEKGIVKIRFFMTIFGRTNITAAEEQIILADFQDNFIDSSNLITVFSTVACPLWNVTNEEGVTVTFPSTPAGELAYSWQRCFGGTGARAEARCEGGYKDGTRWGSILYHTGCQAVPELNSSSSTTGLQELADITLTDKTEVEVTSVINDTKTLTAPDVNLTSADIIYTADILYNTLTSGVSTAEVLEGSIDITDNILNVKQEIITGAQQINNAANRIIRSIDDLTADVDLMGQTSLKIVRPLVAALVWRQVGTALGDIVIGIKLSENNARDNTINEALLDKVQNADDVMNPSTDAAIFLPRELYRGNTKSSFHLYGNTNLFNVQNGRFAVNSKVAAARLSVNDVPVVDLGDLALTAVFYPIQKTSEHMVCGYWNYTANEDAGGWSTAGCTTFRDQDRVVCKCNHLTNFAVLIDLEAERISDEDKEILSIITKVGLIISIIGLGLTVITFVIFKHLRKGRGQQVLVNLSVAMLCSAIIFLVGMDKVDNRAGCKAVAALLHYFILVSFMWMLVEGVLQYLRFVKVLGTYIPNFMIKSMIPAWGLPLIPVIVVLAIDHDLYFSGDKGYCWLQYEAMLYAFIIPVAVVMVTNVIIFLMVMFKLLCRKSKVMSSNQSDSKMAFLHFRAAVSVFVVLGLTWVFGFLAMTDARIVFHYLFAILNAFQGFFIFLLFTFRERQIRKAWRDLCCGKPKYKSTESGSDSKSRKYSAPNTNSTGVLGSENGSQGAEFRNPIFK